MEQPIRLKQSGPKSKHFFSLTLSRTTIHQQCWSMVGAMQHREMGLVHWIYLLIFSTNSNKQPHKHNLGAYKNRRARHFPSLWSKGKKPIQHFCSGVRNSPSLLEPALGEAGDVSHIVCRRSKYKEPTQCWQIQLLVPHRALTTRRKSNDGESVFFHILRNTKFIRDAHWSLAAAVQCISKQSCVILEVLQQKKKVFSASRNF